MREEEKGGRDGGKEIKRKEGRFHWQACLYLEFHVKLKVEKRLLYHAAFST